MWSQVPGLGGSALWLDARVVRKMVLCGNWRCCAVEALSGSFLLSCLPASLSAPSSAKAILCVCVCVCKPPAVEWVTCSSWAVKTTIWIWETNSVSHVQFQSCMVWLSFLLSVVNLEDSKWLHWFWTVGSVFRTLLFLECGFKVPLCTWACGSADHVFIWGQIV